MLNQPLTPCKYCQKQCDILCVWEPTEQQHYHFECQLKAECRIDSQGFLTPKRILKVVFTQQGITWQELIGQYV